MSRGHLVQLLCSGKATQSRFPRNMSGQLFTVSKEGDSIACMNDLVFHLVPSHQKRWNLWCFNYCPLSLVLSLDTSENSLSLSLVVGPAGMQLTFIMADPMMLSFALVAKTVLIAYQCFDYY